CLGASLTVPTIYGDVEMKIPAGTQPSQVFKIKNKGVKDVRRDAYGDEFVHLNVKIPTNLSKEQKDALNEFKNASPKGDSWFQKFKNAFKK
ncbi:MAG: DnaJ C-terminal domain-containing protein, partial [Bacilli bacterium]